MSEDDEPVKWIVMRPIDSEYSQDDWRAVEHLGAKDAESAEREAVAWAAGERARDARLYCVTRDIDLRAAVDAEIRERDRKREAESAVGREKSERATYEQLKAKYEGKP